jgi:hypothetical protein
MKVERKKPDCFEEHSPHHKHLTKTTPITGLHCEKPGILHITTVKNNNPAEQSP